jgi:Flp pilus assembly protein TadG
LRRRLHMKEIPAMAERSGNVKRKGRRAREAGQTTVFFILVLGIFMLGGLCLAFDLSNMWFHRQAAQTAADAACTAGAMDLLVNAQGAATGHQGFTIGTNFDCASGSTASVCQYAAKNGYNSASTTPGNLVSVSFPAAVSGITTPPVGLAGAHPFIRVDVLDHVQTFFVGLLSGGRTADVRAFATCGLELATAPIPLIVLDPRSTDGATLSTQGNPVISIYGGPQQSIQVNSSAAAAVNIGGSASVDLSQGGPGSPPTGSDLGVWGGPATAPGGFNPGTTGHWMSPAAPINDPFAQVVAPAQPTHVGTITSVLPGVSGCPAIGVIGCDRYSPGYYATGIDVKGPGGPNLKPAIFDPGIYYIVGGFTADPNSCLRPSTEVGDGSGGTMFYFADTNSISVSANSGKKCPSDPSTFFNTTSGTGSIQFGAKCTATSSIPSNLPASLSGSVLLGPCQAGTISPYCDGNCGTNYGDPAGAADPLGVQRGFLFFQNRAKNAGTNPEWQGGGQFLLSGTMYFHQCVTSGSDTGAGCSAASAYNDKVTLGGNSGSGTYVLGQIVADQVKLTGTSGLTMDLNPSTVFSILKASLLQ